MSWILTAFLFAGPHMSAQGGPITIEGFTSEATCKTHIKEVLEVRFKGNMAWAYCDPVRK